MKGLLILSLLGLLSGCATMTTRDYYMSLPNEEQLYYASQIRDGVDVCTKAGLPNTCLVEISPATLMASYGNILTVEDYRAFISAQNANQQFIARYNAVQQSRTAWIGAVASGMNTYSQAGNQSYPSNNNSGYLGKLSSNQYDPESVSNPYGQYGNSYSTTSINNPYGTYGSKYSPVSVANPYAVGGPKIIDPKSGKYLGNLNSNTYDPDSVSNPYGRYGSTYSPDSINNPYGQYGNMFSPNSVTNPYATSSPIIVAPEE